MRACVVYESFFGNTREVAESIADGIREHVGEVSVAEVGNASPVLNLDLLVVGGPTHAWGMTRESTRRDAREQARKRGMEPISAGIGVREWIAGLDDRAARSVATFDTVIRTRWFPTGSAAKSASASLVRHGFGPLDMPEHFYVTDVTGPLEDGETERARRWGVELGAHLLAPDHARSSP